jgi:hypothetical protein
METATSSRERSHLVELELRGRLATADGPHEMLTLLEEELMRGLCETAGLGLVRHTSSVIAATSGAVRVRLDTLIADG